MIKRLFVIPLFFFYIIIEAASPAPIAGKCYVVVSAQPYATQVGIDILKQGGNAIDSAVAIGYALAVVQPCCGNIGGGGFMLIRLANGAMTFIDFREKAPHRATPSHYLDKNGNVISDYLSTGHITGSLAKPYLAVGVPGTVKGLDYALKKYGTFSRQQVIAPAIKLAEKGFTLLPHDIDILKTAETNFRKDPSLGAIFLKNNRSYQPNERLVQRNLAATLRKIAIEGPSAFYEGKIARTIVSASQQHGGLITLSDLRNYSVEESPPLICSYKGYQVATSPPPGSGVTICEALKILEPYPLRQLGFHSAMGIHYIVEAMRFAYLDRNQYLGDPHFVKNPITRLLSLDHIRAIRKQIHSTKATPTSSIHATSQEGRNTTSYVVVDKQGNAVSVTYTLNDFFGAKVIPGDTGFFLNNELADFTIKPGVANIYGLVQGANNLIGPNKRPLSSMSPTFLLKNDQLYMVIGAPGGSTIPTQLIGVIQNVIDYGMNIQEAENAPRIHMQAIPDMIYMEPFAISKDTERLLRKMGYKLQLGSPFGTPLWGEVTGILIDPETHIIYGALDSRQSEGSSDSHHD